MPDFLAPQFGLKAWNAAVDQEVEILARAAPSTPATGWDMHAPTQEAHALFARIRRDLPDIRATLFDPLLQADAHFNIDMAMVENHLQAIGLDRGAFLHCAPPRPFLCDVDSPAFQIVVNQQFFVRLHANFLPRGSLLGNDSTDPFLFNGPDVATGTNIHELAHLTSAAMGVRRPYLGLTPLEAMHEAYLEECRADSFEVVWHTLRDGPSSTWANVLTDMRNNEMARALDITHWTINVLQPAHDLGVALHKEGWTAEDFSPVALMKHCAALVDRHAIPAAAYAALRAVAYDLEDGVPKEFLARRPASDTRLFSNMFSSVFTHAAETRRAHAAAGGVRIRDWVEVMAKANPNRAHFLRAVGPAHILDSAINKFVQYWDDGTLGRHPDRGMQLLAKSLKASADTLHQLDPVTGIKAPASAVAACRAAAQHTKSLCAEGDSPNHHNVPWGEGLRALTAVRETISSHPGHLFVARSLEGLQNLVRDLVQVDPPQHTTQKKTPADEMIPF